MFCPLCGKELREVERDKYGNIEYRCDRCEQTFNFLSIAGEQKVLTWE